MKRGLLLANLGTPDDPSVPAVRRYLAEFLMDPYVVDIPAIARALLVYGIILPTRPRKSAAAYAKVWTKRGSPLLFHSQDLEARVRETIGDDWSVALGMRYGKPSLRLALERLRSENVGEVVFFPLYPQYSYAATESSIEKVKTELAAMNWSVPLKIIDDFFETPSFLDAFAAAAQPGYDAFRPDYVLFSFHGVPERHVTRTDATGSFCLSKPTCCDAMVAENRRCYRAQCYATARGLASRLKLTPGRWSVSFQSRLGRTPWIQPFTDFRLPELANDGVQRLYVLCPSFTADCLETLEEVEIRSRDTYAELTQGKGELRMAPSVNSSAPWVKSVIEMARAAT